MSTIIRPDPSNSPPHAWLEGDPYGTAESDAGGRLTGVMSLGACSCVPAPGLEADRRRLQVLGGTWLGTCGDANHAYGYHVAACQLPASDYSMQGSVNRPANAAYGCAIDIGMNWAAARAWLRWLIAEIAADRILGVPEVIGSYDGRNVRYWSDQTGWHTDGVAYTGTGHDTWTHVSCYRSTALVDHQLLTGWSANGRITTPQPQEEIDMLPDERANLKATDSRVRRLVEGSTTFADDDPDPTKRGQPIPLVLMVKQISADVAEVKARPVGTVTLSAEDRAVIVADLAGEMAQKLGPLLELAARLEN